MGHRKVLINDSRNTFDFVKRVSQYTLYLSFSHHQFFFFFGGNLTPPFANM
ncbi:hypothetical protein HYC85_030746 [Camellia sinensis]|uniref:Uncharacterized protein n=1 Tax=Camellia sinensis TaxID=4442 RepID=A0A7J7G2N3_CAMSI|nr:hypothetical protein HYC85_030746 [Camellia sinensis]